MGSRHPEEMADWSRSLEVNNEAGRPSLVALEGRLDLVPSNNPRPLKGVGSCWACGRRVGDAEYFQMSSSFLHFLTVRQRQG